MKPIVLIYIKIILFFFIYYFSIEKSFKNITFLKIVCIFYMLIEIILLLLFLYFSKENSLRNMIIFLAILKLIDIKKKEDEKILQNNYFFKKIKLNELISGDIILYSNFDKNKFSNLKFIFFKYRFTHIAIMLNDKVFTHSTIEGGTTIENKENIFNSSTDNIFFIVRTGINFTNKEINDIKKNISIHNVYTGCIPWVMNILKKYNKINNYNYLLISIILNLKNAMKLSKNKQYFTLENPLKSN
jgi:hypothetical protein